MLVISKSFPHCFFHSGGPRVNRVWQNAVLAYARRVIFIGVALCSVVRLQYACKSEVAVFRARDDHIRFQIVVSIHLHYTGMVTSWRTASGIEGLRWRWFLGWLCCDHLISQVREARLLMSAIRWTQRAEFSLPSYSQGCGGAHVEPCALWVLCEFYIRRVFPHCLNFGNGACVYSWRRYVRVTRIVHACVRVSIPRFENGAWLEIFLQCIRVRIWTCLHCLWFPVADIAYSRIQGTCVRTSLLWEVSMLRFSSACVRFVTRALRNPQQLVRERFSTIAWNSCFQVACTVECVFLHQACIAYVCHVLAHFCATRFPRSSFISLARWFEW